ncbi:MAG: diguanylate cyclase [Bacillota bacterium]|nr:diguanylate cyclase [Bacillota bacterium]
MLRFVRDKKAQNILSKYTTDIIFIILVLFIVIKPPIIEGKLLILTFSVPFSILIFAAKYWKKFSHSKLLNYSLSFLSFILYIINMRIFKFDIVYFRSFLNDNSVLAIIYYMILSEVISVTIIGFIIAYEIDYLKSFRPAEQVFGIRQGMIINAITLCVIFKLFRHLIAERDKFKWLSKSDSLTPAVSMSHALETGQGWISDGCAITLIIIDTDRFKQINNTYGHSAGNKILIQVAQVLKEETKEYNNLIGRMGGNEFIVIIKKDKNDNIMPGFISRRLYNTLKNKLFILDPEIDPIKLSFAIGEAHSHGDKNENIEKLLHNAEKNMFLNKFKNIRGSIYNKQEPPKLTDAGYDLLNVLAEKDMYTFVHSGYTAYYARLLAKELELSSEIIDEIYTAGWLHDIGKTLISSDIIRKSSKLTEKEYSVMKTHVSYGLRILSQLDLSERIINGVRCHHEHWDGTGYPSRLSGSNIPIEGRIVKIADSYSAMIIKRVYRNTLSIEDALLELKSKSGIQFDPYLVSLFTNILEASDAS